MIRQKGLGDAASVSYSSVYGRGIYFWDGTVIQDPLRTQDKDLLPEEQVAQTPVLTNVNTKEQFFPRWFAQDMNEVGRVKKEVLNPPSDDVILWPVDVVQLDEVQADVCTSAVLRVYSDTSLDDDGYCGPRFAALFPVDGMPYLQSCTELIDIAASFGQPAMMSTHNWRDAGVREMAVAVVQALARLNEDGYAYLDFHRSRIFFKTAEERLSAFFDYSALLCLLGDFDGYPGVHLRPQSPYYPLEFADPAYLLEGEGAVNALDLESQNYSLTAFLFYLLMGFHPYDGSRLMGMADDNLTHHYAKYNMYTHLPIFVFDPLDTSNAFGALDEDQEVIVLWQELPADVKYLFYDTLQEQHAMRRAARHHPTPRMWLHAFKNLGWA